MFRCRWIFKGGIHLQPKFGPANVITGSFHFETDWFRTPAALATLTQFTYMTRREVSAMSTIQLFGLNLALERYNLHNRLVGKGFFPLKDWFQITKFPAFVISGLTQT
jgi:hypothetical protein